MSRSMRVLGVATAALMLAGGALTGCGSTASGEELVNTKCGDACHTLDVVDNSANVSEAEWAATVADMEDKGMDVTDAERTAIIEYLVAQSGGQ